MSLRTVLDTSIVALIVFACAAIGAAAASSSETTYVFGTNLALDAGSAQSFSNTQLQTLQGLEIWQDWWNALPAANRTTKWGEVFNVQLHVERFSNYTADYSNTNMYNLFNTYYNMSQNTSINYFFSQVASPWGIQLRNYSYYELGIPFMCGTLIVSRTLIPMHESMT